MTDSIRGLREGNFWVQDLAASLPARLIGRNPRLPAMDRGSLP